MSKKMLVMVRLGLIFGILILAIMGSLYALDIFEDAYVREVLFKMLIVVGIWTGASVLVMLVTGLGGDDSDSAGSSKGQDSNS